MATKVFMEALSPTMEEGRLVKWNKSEGDVVKSGDILAEIETDKAVMELVARGDGVLRQRLISEGDSVPVGTVVGVIGSKDEDVSALLADASVRRAAPAASTAAPLPVASPVAAASPSGSGAAVPPSLRSTRPTNASGAPAPSPGRMTSSPLARKLAGERGVDLALVAGSGPGGRIIKRDIEAAMVGGAGAPLAIGHLAATGEADFRDVPLTQIRKTIARRLAESIGPIPTFYLTAEFDLQRASDLRAAMGDEFKVSFNDIVLKATATALSQHPEVNAHWLGDQIRYHKRVHVGMAVATDDGLIVPVIFDADRKRMSEISAEAKALAGRARERKLKPEEYTGSTFSVSNLGMFGIDQFTAIINPPEVAILAIGAIEEKAVVVAGAVESRKRLRVTMSCDHRVVDGAVGAQFLQTLRRMIENPLMLVY